MDKFDELEIELLKADLYARIKGRSTNLEMVAIATGRDLHPIDISKAVFENIEGDNEVLHLFGKVDYDKIIKGSKN